MHTDASSFDEKYQINLRYEDFIPNVFHQIKISSDYDGFYTQLISISRDLTTLTKCDPRRFGGLIFIVYRENNKLYQIRKDSSRIQLWTLENGQVPIEILLDNFNKGIR